MFEKFILSLSFPSPFYVAIQIEFAIHSLGILCGFSFSSPINFHLIVICMLFGAVRCGIACTVQCTHIKQQLILAYTLFCRRRRRLPSSIEQARNYKANVTKCHKIIYMPIGHLQSDAHQRVTNSRNNTVYRMQNRT